MGHQCCSKQKVKRGLWSPEEDEHLIRHITTNGHGSWSSVPKLAGLQRCGKSCRLRWINYLRPDLKRGSFSAQEERTIIDVHRMLGNRWAQIAKHLPGRTDNEVKNFWNSSIKKKLMAQGLDPNTHNLLPPHHHHHHHHPHTDINKNVSKFSLTHQKPTSSLYSVNSHQILKDASFTTLPTPNENLQSCEYQNPNIVWPNMEEQKTESQCSMRSIPNSYSPINEPGFGILDDNCMWGGKFEGFETTRQDEMKKVCEIEIEKTNIDFDFEFVESSLVSLWNV